jgi:FimV-like protein
MLLYVIPFILLLVIAIVLKKRDTNKQAEQTSASKTKAKKGSSTKKTPQKTQIAENPAVEKKKTTPLSADIRNKIEALIRERNFFSAEAQINQALNKDNSQHELYLLLLEIHILQKDEFATKQLINHLRSLELDDILEQALAKKAAYQQEDSKVESPKDTNTVNFQPESSVTPPTKQKNIADFDALMNTAAPSATVPHQSFDQLQQESLSTKTDAVEEIKPLDFNTISFDQSPVETPKVKVEVPTSTVEEIKPLDFSTFSLESSPVAVAPKQEVTPVTEEIKPLDFSFSLDIPAAEQTTTIADAAITAEPVLDEKPEFNFDFSATETVAPTEAKIAVEETKPSLDLDFNLEPVTTTEQQPVEPAPAKAAGVSFDISNISSSASKADQNDPLVQSFPELIEVNEISLNLDLAQQYIQLGAFESALELLAEQETEYTAEQRQQADQLRNQIAS